MTENTVPTIEELISERDQLLVRVNDLEHKVMEASNRAAQTRDSVVRLKGKWRSTRRQRDGLAADLVQYADQARLREFEVDAKFEGYRQAMRDALEFLTGDRKLDPPPKRPPPTPPPDSEETMGPLELMGS